MIFLDTNVLSETFKPRPSEAVISWISRFEVEFAISTIVIGEVLHGIHKIDPDPRAVRWANNLEFWRDRLAGRIYAYDQGGAEVYGRLMGSNARAGHPMSVPDGMIAAIALANRGKLATRNVKHFETTGLELINPWEF